MIAPSGKLATTLPRITPSHLQPRDQHFRSSLSRFATGVAVVTFDGRDGRHGMTVNSFTSVSMDPPLILVSVAKTTKSHDELRGQPFTVNILGAEQQELARHFAGRSGAEPLWREGATAPRLDGVLAYFTCAPWAEYNGGDHTLYVGEVVEFDYRLGDALAFINSQFTVIPAFILGATGLVPSPAASG